MIAEEAFDMSDSKTNPPAGKRKSDPLLPALGIGAFALGIVGYGLYGAVMDDLVIPMSNGRTGVTRVREYIHFHGAGAWLVFLGLVIVAAACVVYIVQGFSATPGNKANRNVANGLAVVGAGLVIVMIIVSKFGLL